MSQNCIIQVQKQAEQSKKTVAVKRRLTAMTVADEGGQVELRQSVGAAGPCLCACTQTAAIYRAMWAGP